MMYDCLSPLLMTQSYLSVGGELRGPAHTDFRRGVLVW